MSAPYNDVFAKTTAAAAALLDAALLPSHLPIYQGEATTQGMTVPCIRLWTETAEEEDPQYSGNFWSNFMVEVIYPAGIDVNGIDPKPLNDALVQKVMDVFSSSTLPADLNTIAVPIVDFTCIAQRNRQLRFNPSGDQWINRLEMQLLVCASSIYP